jgi:hypothetical protein
MNNGIDFLEGFSPRLLCRPVRVSNEGDIGVKGVEDDEMNIYFLRTPMFTIFHLLN